VNGISFLRAKSGSQSYRMAVLADSDQEARAKAAA
jgi:hypothetical protein